MIYIQTLIGDTPIPGREDTDLRWILDHTKYVWSEGSLPAECNAGEVEAIGKLSLALSPACENRMFFSTKGGHIGLGPPETQPGDLICILFSAKELYVLRGESDGTEPLQILGDAFVHGWQEIDDMYEQIRCNWEVFEIG